MRRIACLLLLLYAPMVAQIQKDELADLYKQFGMNPPSQQDACDGRVKKSVAATAKVLVADRNEWADKYDRLAEQYNALLAENARLRSAQNRQLSPPPPPLIVQPRQPLNCMAIELSGGITTLSCN